ncbi:uncharacterized protein LOC144438789 [Glandiceps talaboti]
MKLQVLVVTVLLVYLVVVQAQYKKTKVTEKEVKRNLIDKLSKIQKQKRVNEKKDTTVCSETCSYSGDGECDDGGAGSLYSLCGLGTDCKDCGSRSYGNNTGCSETCIFSGDGECDDGGPGYDYMLCDLGTDCVDCGSRNNGDTTGCSETCIFSGDGECDDGGPGYDYMLCDLGTDCEDCGSRNNGGK